MRWVIGDIHGMLKPLVALVNEVQRQDSGAQFIFVGDYVNRGPDSRGVIDFLLDLKNARCCRGNHDDVLDLILNDHWLAGEKGSFDPIAALFWFLDHGLDRTLMSYGVEHHTIEIERERRTKKLLDLAKEKIPKTHKKFLNKLPMFVAEPTFCVAHAWWPMEVDNVAGEIDRQMSDASFRHRMLWHRWQIREILDEKSWGRTCYFGHTPIINYPPPFRDEDDISPVTGPKIVLLDTGCVIDKAGRLTAVCVDRQAMIQVDRHAKVVKQPKE
jgi:serine/threonine protein phosphatase 1